MNTFVIIYFAVLSTSSASVIINPLQLACETPLLGPGGSGIVSSTSGTVITAPSRLLVGLPPTAAVLSAPALVTNPQALASESAVLAPEGNAIVSSSGSNAVLIAPSAKVVATGPGTTVLGAPLWAAGHRLIASDTPVLGPDGGTIASSVSSGDVIAASPASETTVLGPDGSAIVSSSVSGTIIRAPSAQVLAAVPPATVVNVPVLAAAPQSLASKTTILGPDGSAIVSDPGSTAIITAPSARVIAPAPFPTVVNAPILAAAIQPLASGSAVLGPDGSAIVSSSGSAAVITAPSARVVAAAPEAAVLSTPALVASSQALTSEGVLIGPRTTATVTSSGSGAIITAPSSSVVEDGLAWNTASVTLSAPGLLNTPALVARLPVAAKTILQVPAVICD